MSRGRRRQRMPELALAAVLVLAIASITWLFLVYPAEVRGGRTDGRELTLVVEGEDGIDDVAAELQRLGAIDDAGLFALYARLLGADERLRRGPVHLRWDMSIRTLLARLAEGLGSTPIDVLVPEGFDRFEIAARLARWDVCGEDEFLAATADRALLDELAIPGASAEGYLLPDTYTFATGSDPREVVRRFVHAYRAATDTLFEGDDARRARLARLGLGRHEVLVLASIVEQEAVVREEQPVIAGVFVNRLESATFLPRHRLQADPTVSYGCKVEPTRPSCEGFEGRRITRAMLEDEGNAYNTYRREGLPPTPICNPGLPAIRAVLEHTEHDYYYFVARGRGQHVFSATLEAHNEGVSDLRDRERQASTLEE
ncbi:MAG: endolytic transglycosylase MltG [Deltaproteobacteria bacterium]